MCAVSEHSYDKQIHRGGDEFQVNKLIKSAWTVLKKHWDIHRTLYEYTVVIIKSDVPIF